MKGSATSACAAGVDCGAGNAGRNRGVSGVPVARLDVEG